MVFFTFCLYSGEYFHDSCCVLKDPKGKSKYNIGNIKLLLTKLEGHTGEYWLNIVELKMERSEVHTKMTKVQYSSVWLGQA